MTGNVGLDFGGVIVPVAGPGPGPGEDTALGDGHGFEEPREGAIESIRRLVWACEKRVWIVSKAGPRMQARTLAWLAAVDFHARTGLPVEHIRFCARREDKVEICRELSIQHFVDDRVHLMHLLRETVPHLYLFGEEGGERSCPHWAQFTTSWAELTGRILGSGSGGTG